MECLQKKILDPDVIFSSHSMFINASLIKRVYS